MNNNLFSIGKIVAPHGVRGDVRIIPWTDFPERFFNLKSVFLDNRNLKLDVERVKASNKFFLIKFKDYDSMDKAETLRNKILMVEKEDLVDLPEGHYYIFDIIGLSVYTEEKEFLGTVKDVLETGSNDVYVVEKDNLEEETSKKNQPLLIPALKEVVKKIDLEDKIMIVKLQEEY